MEIGTAPTDGLLYDQSLHNMSAEGIYDLILKESENSKKQIRFRGYHKGDIFAENKSSF